MTQVVNNQQLATAIVEKLLTGLDGSSLPDCHPGALDHLKGYKLDMISDVLAVLESAK